MAKTPPMKYSPVEPPKPAPRSMPASGSNKGSLKANVKPVSGPSIVRAQLKPIK